LIFFMTSILSPFYRIVSEYSRKNLANKWLLYHIK